MSLGIVLKDVTRPRTSRPRAAARPLAIFGGLGVFAVAAAIAYEGQSLATSANPEQARPWLLVAAILGLAAVRLLDRNLIRPDPAPRTNVPTGFGDPDDLGHNYRDFSDKGYLDHVPDIQVRTEEDRARFRRRVGSVVLLGLGGLYAAAATALVGLRIALVSATWLWLMGLAAVALGAVLIDPWRSRWRPRGLPFLELGPLSAVLGIALWLRLPDLATIPANVHGDEASIGNNARAILAGDLQPVFATGWYSVPALSFALHAATMRVFGDDLFGLRMASAIEGTASIVLLFLLARRLWGPRPALLAAAFLAVAAWHIHFSRTGFHYMQAPVALLLVLYFLVRAIEDRRLRDWVLCGFAMGLCFEVYFAARLAPVVLALYLAYRTATERAFFRTHARGLVALAFGAGVFLAPMAVVFAQDPSSFGARTNGVLITTPANLQHEMAGYGVDSLPAVLAVQAARTLDSFNITGETSLQYGHAGPLFDFWTAALLAMGALGILFGFHSARGFLLASWVWLALILGSVMTTDALFSPHLLVALPALMLAPALLLDSVWLGVTRLTGRVGTYAFAVPLAVVLGLALQGNIHDYFDVQVQERQPASRFTVLSNYAMALNASYRLYVIGRSDWTLNYETPRFLVPHPDAVDVRNAPLELPLARIPARKGVAFLVERGADDFAQRISALRRNYPSGQEVIILERPGTPVFTSYLVENSALTAANPTAPRD